MDVVVARYSLFSWYFCVFEVVTWFDPLSLSCECDDKVIIAKLLEIVIRQYPIPQKFTLK
jgi:hypothetical protein